MSDRFTGCLVAIVMLVSNLAVADALRDPTRPEVREDSPSLSVPRFRISAVLVSDRRRVAVVNGVTVMRGDRVNGATVRAIRNDGVELGYQGRVISVGLAETRVRQ